jgi:hypothetical protein
MLRETRMATATVNAEMDFTWQLAREVAPREVASKYLRKGKSKGMRPARIKGAQTDDRSRDLSTEENDEHRTT